MAKPPFRSRFNVGQPQASFGGLPPFPLPFLPLPGLGLNRIVDVVTRALTANLQFQQTMGQLTLQFVQASAQAGINFVQQVAGVLGDLPPVGGGVVPGRPSIFLEGALGDKAVGRFLVENTLPQPISSKIVATPFTDDAGNQVHPVFSFDPATVELNPAEQAIVTATLSIGPDMAPGVDYVGELEVEGMPGRIAVLIRRRITA